ncbi:MAG: thiamine-phosphate kinase [Armatimonadota bacterium]
MRLSDLGELGLLKRLESVLSIPEAARAPADASAAARVVVGVGDDAAAVDVGGGRVLLLSCDSMVEGVHFAPARCAPDAIGFRAMAAALSDIAAMGGTPAWALVTLAAPSDADAAFAEELIRGARGAAEREGAVVVGGDCVNSPSGLGLDVTVVGEGRRDSLLLRSAAEPGQVVMVTGTVGDSAAGLAVLRGEARVDAEAASYLTERHLLPTPRIAAGTVLAEHEAVTAAIDISDGLLRDAGHIAERSGVRVELLAEMVPISPACRRVADAVQESALGFALGGGEDYELLFTARADAAGAVEDALRSRAQISATVVGEVRAGRGVGVLDKTGQPVNGLPEGWDHFRAGG